MRIAVCDDDSVYAKEIEKIVQTTLLDRHIESKTDLYCDSRELYESNKEYDIAFLDIEMEPYNGLETAQKLKKDNEHIIIFFITSYDQYLDDAMDLNAFRYIKKPLNVKRLQLGIEKALKLVDDTKISFLLKDGKQSLVVSSSQIVYVEIVGHYTKVQLQDGSYISRNKMDFWCEKLIASFFYQVHKSYIVNLKCITNYTRDSITLSNEYRVPIAFRKQTAFRSYFLNYLGGR